MKPYYEQDGVTIFLGTWESVLPSLATGSVRCVVTSPPYNLGDGTFFAHERRRSTPATVRRSRWQFASLIHGYDGHDDAMPYPEYVAWQHAALTECWRLLDDEGAIFYNHKPRPWKNRVRLPLDLNPGLPLRQVIIWDRAAGGINCNPTHYMPTHEWLLVLAKDAWRLRDKPASAVGDLWRIHPEGPGNKHPAPFPIGLPLMALETTRPGPVLDPFCGSGTTLVAAKSLGRPAIGVDTSEAYCEIAAKRLSQGVLDLGA